MPEAPDVGTPGLDYQRAFELTDDLVDLLRLEIDHRAQQLPIHQSADDGRGLDDWQDIRIDPQSREKRLVKRLRHAAFTEALNHLLDVERHPVASRDHRRSLQG